MFAESVLPKIWGRVGNIHFDWRRDECKKDGLIKVLCIKDGHEYLKKNNVKEELIKEEIIKF